jgi:hypothetical protein
MRHEMHDSNFKQPQLRDLVACLREFCQARSALSDQRAQGMPGADAPAAARVE